MSAYDHVTVTVAADSDPDNGINAEGNVTAVPTGTKWPGGNDEPIVPPVVHGTLVAGTCSLDLIASDNFAAGVLGWTFLINIRGLPTINAPNCIVNHTDGATQSVWTILDANGWVPAES